LNCERRDQEPKPAGSQEHCYEIKKCIRIKKKITESEGHGQRTPLQEDNAFPREQDQIPQVFGVEHEDFGGSSFDRPEFLLPGMNPTMCA
jgi:hypothetical protein